MAYSTWSSRNSLRHNGHVPPSEVSLRRRRSNGAQRRTGHHRANAVNGAPSRGPAEAQTMQSVRAAGWCFAPLFTGSRRGRSIGPHVRDHGHVTADAGQAVGWRAPTAAGPVTATVAVPGSKSLTNRALILAAQATAPSTLTGAAPQPRHRSHGGRPRGARRAGRRRRRRMAGGSRHRRADPPRSTAGSPAPSCDSCRPSPPPPTGRPVRRRPGRPAPTDGHDARGAQAAGRPHRRRWPAVHRSTAPARSVAARSHSTPAHRHSSSPACCWRPKLPARRQSSPRRAAGAVHAAHRDDGRGPAVGRGRRRRLPQRLLVGAAGPGRPVDHAVSSPTCPTAHRFSRRPRSPVGR